MKDNVRLTCHWSNGWVARRWLKCSLVNTPLSVWGNCAQWFFWLYPRLLVQSVSQRDIQQSNSTSVSDSFEWECRSAYLHKWRSLFALAWENAFNEIYNDVFNTALNSNGQLTLLTEKHLNIRTVWERINKFKANFRDRNTWKFSFFWNHYLS